jgi:3-dehydroquinate synthase
MRKELFEFSSKKVEYLFDASFEVIKTVYPNDKIVIVTDENVFKLHKKKFEGLTTIQLEAGEEFKQQRSADNIIMSLLEAEADKNTILVGVGGGVVTDITGYTASIYKRGIRLALVPTSILAMVDASVGGKNGVDVGPYKNMVGTVYQPDLLLFDYSFLSTLPHEEWVNGFAEIIKHACIKDASFFNFLSGKGIDDFKNDQALLAQLIEKNVAIKTSVVLKDEFETGDRKLLNFGHTIGHAIENIYQLPHGHAVSIGMMAACRISEEINNFPSLEKEKIKELLQRYQLPVSISYDKESIWQILVLDKKRSNDAMNFILLNTIGDAVIKSIPLTQLKDLMDQCL